MPRYQVLIVISAVALAGCQSDSLHRGRTEEEAVSKAIVRVHGAEWGLEKHAGPSGHMPTTWIAGYTKAGTPRAAIIYDCPPGSVQDNLMSRLGFRWGHDAKPGVYVDGRWQAPRNSFEVWYVKKGSSPVRLDLTQEHADALRRYLEEIDAAWQENLASDPDRQPHAEDAVPWDAYEKAIFAIPESRRVEWVRWGWHFLVNVVRPAAKKATVEANPNSS